MTSGAQGSINASGFPINWPGSSGMMPGILGSKEDVWDARNGE